MAGEEDVELRDLVAQTLEAKGVLGKIRVSFVCIQGRLHHSYSPGAHTHCLLIRNLVQIKDLLSSLVAINHKVRCVPSVTGPVAS